MEKERLILCINRYDQYYDSINNKSNVFLVLGTFIVGGLIAAYSVLSDKVEFSYWVYTLFFLLTGLGIATMLIVIQASAPFITVKIDSSLIYFASVSHRSFENFSNESQKRNEDSELQDLRLQVHQLSLGLTKKFYKLKLASWLFSAQFTLFVPFIISVFINLK